MTRTRRSEATDRHDPHDLAAFGGAVEHLLRDRAAAARLAHTLANERASEPLGVPTPRAGTGRSMLPARPIP